MGKLICRFIKVITKADRFRQAPDTFFIASQEMPTVCSRRTFVFRQITQISLFLSCRERGGLAWVKAHGHDIKLRSGLECENLERAHHAIQHLRAKHWALVIDER